MIARRTLLAGLLPGLAACAAHGPDGPPMGTETEIAALARAIRALGPGVDPAEADRAARVAYVETYTLAREYQITDPPLVHNTKVNMGLRPRGLCWHWAEDMEARLSAERFRTLALHRAIANADISWRIDHSTVIVSAADAAWNEGLVLDPWRQGGTLYWGAVESDPKYSWRAQRDVLEWKRRKLVAEGKLPPGAVLAGG